MARGRVRSCHRAAVDRLNGSLRGGAEVRMVEEVEEVKVELDLQPFFDLPVLTDGEVSVVEVGATAEASRLNVGRQCAERIADERKGSAIGNGVRATAGDAALAREKRTLRRGKAGLGERAVLVELAACARDQVGFVRTLIEGEVVAVLRGDDAGGFPSAEHVALDEVGTLQLGQVVGCVGYEHVRTVDVRGAVVETRVRIVGACLLANAAAGVVDDDVRQRVRPGVGGSPGELVADAALYYGLKAVIVGGTVVGPVGERSIVAACRIGAQVVGVSTRVGKGGCEPVLRSDAVDVIDIGQVQTAVADIADLEGGVCADSLLDGKVPLPGVGKNGAAGSSPPEGLAVPEMLDGVAPPRVRG